MERSFRNFPECEPYCYNKFLYCKTGSQKFFDVMMKHIHNNKGECHGNLRQG